jgi:hypothetical protein
MYITEMHMFRCHCRLFSIMAVVNNSDANIGIT